MYYQPPRALGLLVGVVLIAWALGVAVLLLGVSAGHGFGVVTAVASIGGVAALGVAGLLGYWIYALARLSYALDRNGLVIHWGAIRQIIPLEAIERLVPGTAVGVPAVEGVSWLGYHVGRAHIDRIGEVLFYSTHQTPDQVLFVMTTEKNYAISVPDPPAFARQIQVRQDLGPTAHVTHHVERVLPAAQGFSTDHRGWAMAGAAVVLCAFAWLLLAVQYGGLADTVAVHFPRLEPTPLSETNGKGILVAIPRAATVVLAIDLVAGVALYAWDRVVGRLVLGASIAMQVAFLIALEMTVVRGA